MPDCCAHSVACGLPGLKVMRTDHLTAIGEGNFDLIIVGAVRSLRLASVLTLLDAPESEDEVDHDLLLAQREELASALLKKIENYGAVIRTLENLAEGRKADQRRREETRCEQTKDAHSNRAMGAGAITGPAWV